MQLERGEPQTSIGDHGYPPTPKTWIEGELERGPLGREAVWRHVMAIYAQPLQAYCRALFHRVDDPADLVNGFIAHRLDDLDYFSEWRTSGRRLRDWLRCGIEIHVRDRYRSKARDRKVADESAVVDDTTRTEDPVVAYDRQLALAVVEEARRCAEAECLACGLGDHWELFVAHSLEHESYASIKQRTGIDEVRAARMNDTAKRRFREALRDIIRRDGVPESRIDLAIRELIAALGR